MTCELFETLYSLNLLPKGDYYLYGLEKLTARTKHYMGLPFSQSKKNQWSGLHYISRQQFLKMLIRAYATIYMP